MNLQLINLDSLFKDLCFKLGGIRNEVAASGAYIGAISRLIQSMGLFTYRLCPIFGVKIAVKT